MFILSQFPSFHPLLLDHNEPAFLDSMSYLSVCHCMEDYMTAYIKHCELRRELSIGSLQVRQFCVTIKVYKWFGTLKGCHEWVSIFIHLHFLQFGYTPYVPFTNQCPYFKSESNPKPKPKPNVKVNCILRSRSVFYDNLKYNTLHIS